MTIDDLSPDKRDRVLSGLSPSTPSGLELRGVARALRQPIAEVARRGGLHYDRAERILNGRAKARPEEISAIERALGIPQRVSV
jgi:hypothetical protein